jgi:general secretion pathway protein E
MMGLFANKLNINKKLELTEVVEWMINDRILDQVTGKKILKENKVSKRHPLDVVSTYSVRDRRRRGRYLTIDDLTEWLAKKVDMEYIKIDAMKINIESVSSLVPHAYAKRLQIIPLFTNDKEAIFATAEPFEQSWVGELAVVNKKEIKLKLASPKQISLLLQEIFVVQKAISKMATKQSREQQKLLKDGKLHELDKLLERGKQRNYGDKDNSVVQIVDWLINYGASEKASDIHLEPKKGLGQIRFRVDGKLQVVYKLDPEAMLSVISRLKVLGDMKLDEKRKPQDGRIKRFLDNGKKVEMRLSVIPSYYGEKMVIRIFDQQVAGKDLSFIGFSEEDTKTWEEMINSSQGLVLVTGPTGSGKTTTLYTSLNIVATEDVNVCTVEDPVEMTVDTINQVQVNHQVGMGFPEVIRAFLRQDPDIIMVGEVRDLDTAETAVQASLTGHLVFSTLHTNGALATIQRLVDLGLPTFLINSSLRGILAQRLVRKLCVNCKDKVVTPVDSWASLTDNDGSDPPEFVYKAKGCNDCKKTGYMGRMCIYELVKFTDEIKRTIHQRVEMAELKEKTKGMFTSFRTNCIRKVLSGETTLEEVLKIVY